MAFSILSWNIEENQDWWVRLSDTGTAILVQVFGTLADAQAVTNICGSYTTDGYGPRFVVLTAGPGKPLGFGLFQSAFVWHMRVTGQNGDATSTFKVAKFCELSPISDPIYRNVDLITKRGVYEITIHSTVNYKYIIECPGIPDVEPGDIVTVSSSRLGTFLAQVSNIRIDGTTVSLISSVNLEKYALIQKE